MNVSEMTTRQFEQKAKELVCIELNRDCEVKRAVSEVHTVWYSKVLQNKKRTVYGSGVSIIF